MPGTVVIAFHMLIHRMTPLCFGVNRTGMLGVMCKGLHTILALLPGNTIIITSAGDSFLTLPSLATTFYSLCLISTLGIH